MERRATTAKAPTPGAPNPQARRGFEDALRVCEKGWFPIQPILFRSIQEKVREGFYDDNNSLLIKDLKADVSLFLYSLRKLHEVVVDVSKYRNPVHALLHLRPSEVRNLLDVAEGQISAHGSTDLPKIQALRMRHSVISSVTAESLAEKTGDDPGLTFSCALLRQLGLNLVCFNYPTIYNRALAASAVGEGELESNIYKLLGFTPDLLAKRLLSDWRLDDKLGDTIAVKTSRIGSGMWEEEKENSLLRIAKYCEVGESIARVSDPEHNPSASRDWELLSGELEAIAGADALSLITPRLERTLQQYSILAPKTFSKEFNPQKSIQQANFYYANHLFNENQYLQKCSDDVKEKMRGVYQYIRHKQVAPEAINALSLHALPAMGFEKGCIYLLDERTMTLVPRLRLAGADLKRYKPLSAGSVDGGHAVVEALYSNLPLRQEEAFMHGEKINHISWSIGNGNKSGVLHLEFGSRLAAIQPQEVINLFKAVRECVNACLSLR